MENSGNLWRTSPSGQKVKPLRTTNETSMSMTQTLHQASSSAYDFVYLAAFDAWVWMNWAFLVKVGWQFLAIWGNEMQ